MEEFGWPPGEIAAMLVAGYTLRGAAERFGVNEHTVRAQLKSIFRKTGTHSQSDLIRRVMMGPAGWIASGQGSEH